MSTIKLESYVIARLDKLGGEVIAEPIHGACSRVAADGRPIIDLPDVALPSVMRHPPGNFLMLYGLRDSNEEKADRSRPYLGNQKVVFANISISFDVGEIFPGVIHEEHIPSLRFINIMRTSKDVQIGIVNKFHGYMEDDKEDTSNMRRIQQIAQRPDLFSRLLKEKPWRDVEVLVVPVNIPQPSGAFKTRQFAIVTPEAIPVEIVQNVGSPVIIDVPAFIKKKAKCQLPLVEVI